MLTPWHDVEVGIICGTGFSPFPVDSRDQAQVVKHGGEPVCLLSHLAGLSLEFLKLLHSAKNLSYGI